MTESEFTSALRAVLDSHSVRVTSTMRQLLAALPAKAQSLNFEVFPSQDGEGDFSIRANLDGPDLYVLNKAINEYADLFVVRWTETGVDPPVPIVASTTTEFEVNDVVVDCAASWLRDVWESLGDVECSIPIRIVGHDDYGTSTPIDLHSGAAA